MQAQEQTKAIAAEDVSVNRSATAMAPRSDQLPVRYQTPSYEITDTGEVEESFGQDEEFVVKVGADISSTTGPVILRDIMKKLAALKNMNVSWASDVNQSLTVDVDISADDDYFKALDNLLRQRDYFHEVMGNTIVIKYKDTKRFHLAMPFTVTQFDSDVGGDLLGTARKESGGDIYGSMRLKSWMSGDGKNFDVWNEIKLNLDKILDIWSRRTSLEQKGAVEGDRSGARSAASEASTETGNDTQKADSTQKQAQVDQSIQAGLGYYTIDKPVGLITVTAPRTQLIKISEYLDSLKKELFRQISIEAKIIEVTVTGERRVGINWEELLNSSVFDFEMNFGDSNIDQPLGAQGSRVFTIGTKSFSLFISAIEKHGETKVLANPRLSVMNGQPAMISVGENTTYIDSVESKIDESVITYTVTTGTVMSGLALSVIATLMDEDEIVMQLTPVTSELESLEYRTFGANNQVGLPVVNVRELTTMVRVKDGEMLVIGGLIDNTNEGNDQKVPVLGKIPLLSKFFGLEEKTKFHKELIILLKPQVIS